MKNIDATWFVMMNYKSRVPSTRLAAQFAVQDIIEFDVDSWLDIPIHEHLGQFVSLGRKVAEDNFEESMKIKKHQRKFMDANLRVSETMIKYAEIHYKLKEKSMSER